MRSALALCLLMLTLAACGATPRDSAKDFTGAQAGVAAAIEDLESAARDNDPDLVCSKLFTAGLLATIKERRTDCEAAVQDAFQDADLLDLTVDRISIAGAKATATVTSGTGARMKTDTLSLEKVGAAWRISSLQA